MDIAAKKPYGDGREETCRNCGAEYFLHITKQTGHNEREEYNCPVCNEEYYAQSSMPIQITLMNKRKNGEE